MINILFISITSSTGGGPAHIYSILKNIDRTKFNTFVVSPNDGEYFEKFKLYSNVIDIDLRHNYLKNILKIKKIVKDNNIHICHSHGRGAGIYSRPLKIIKSSLKVVHTFHGIHYERCGAIKKFLNLTVERLLRNFTDCCIAVSQKEYEEALRLKMAKKNHIYMIYNGIEIEKFNVNIEKKLVLRKLGIDISDYKYIVGCFGRLHYEKGQLNLIKAFKKFNMEYPDSLLLLIGDGPDKSLILDSIKEFKLENNVELRGFQSNIPELLQSIDLYVSSSYKEGLPYILIEALASKTLVVATRTTGNDEIIFDKKTGLLCEVGNPDSLCEKMIEIKKRPNDNETYIQNGIKMVKQRFDIKIMIEKLSKIYEEILCD